VLPVKISLPLPGWREVWVAGGGLGVGNDGLAVG